MADQLMRRGTHRTNHTGIGRAGLGVRLTRPFVVVVAVGVIALLALALTLGGWDSNPPTQSDPLSPTSVALRAPTATATSKTADLGDRTTRSKVGAVNAAARYATLLAQVFPLDSERARAVVADAASDDARARLTAAIDANLRPLQEQSTAIEGTTTYREAVLATRLTSYSVDAPPVSGSSQQGLAAAGGRARVQVWTLLTVSQTPAPGMPNATNAIGTFGTVSLSLVWERGAWRIDDSTTVDGPTPLIDGTPSTGAQLDSALRGFTDWRPE